MVLSLNCLSIFNYRSFGNFVISIFYGLFMQIIGFSLQFPNGIINLRSLWCSTGEGAGYCSALAIKSFRADACFLMFCFFYNISNEEGEEAARDVLHRVADY